MQKWQPTILLLLVGACTDLNDCGSAVTALPAGGLPPSQTVEGGGQMLLGATGVQKFVADARTAIAASLDEGACVLPGQVGTPSGGFLATGARYCQTNQGGSPSIPDACGSMNGCNMDIALDSLTAAPGPNGTIVGQLQVDIQSVVPLSGQVVGIGFSCTAFASAADVTATVPVSFAIGTDGELVIDVSTVADLTLALSVPGCSVVNDVANLLATLQSAHTQALAEKLTSVIRNVARSYQRAPTEGRVNIAGLVADTTTTDNHIEFRALSGGTVTSSTDGLGLGLVIGANSDIDETTRTPDLISEPAACMTGLAPLDLTMRTALTQTMRNTFLLPAAGEFAQAPAINRDVMLGVSEVTLDLLGHHMTASGAFCIETGFDQFSQLTLGNLSVLVPSAAAAGAGDEPLRVTVRPARGLDVDVGATTSGAPTLGLHLDGLLVEVFATLAGGEVSLFALRFDAAWQGQLAVVQPTTHRAGVEVVLGDFAADNATVISRAALVTEPDAELLAVLPSLMAFVLPSLTQPVRYALPDVGGFALGNPELVRVATASGNYLGVAGDLIAVPDNSVPIDGGAFAASVQSVAVPKPAEVRAALSGAGGAVLPSVTLTVDQQDAMMQPLEWRWQLNEGLWRGLSSSFPLVVSEAALAWQGRHKLTVSARPSGSHAAWSTPVELDVIVDSLGPKIFVDQAAWVGDVLTFTALDAVFGRDGLTWAFGKVGESAPTTPFGTEPTITRAQADQLAVGANAFVVFARDPQNNESSVQYAHVPPPVDPGDPMDPGDAAPVPSEGGCCGATTDPRGAALWCILLGAIWRRRRIAS